MSLKKYLFGLLVIVLLALPLLASCNGTEETSPTPTASTPTAATPTPTVAANWWDDLGEPQYGGSITYAPGMFNAFFDPYSRAEAAMYYLEQMWMPNWALDREVWSFATAFLPEEYVSGLLAETWEMTDPQTLTVKLREGIYWQDKEPVNGREFVAADVEYHYARELGTGHGFTEPSAFHGSRLVQLANVTATDKYTVVFEFKSPAVLNLQATILDPDARNSIEAPEVIEQYGDALDWRNAVGTGPWILTEYIDGSSLSYERNPNYWGYDERHPDNQLPYADTFTILNISDISTRLAALRTGQIDFVDSLGLQQAQTLADSNPELQQAMVPFINTHGINMNIREAPYNDIKVRKALQMSIDRELIAATYYDGQFDPTPCGWINPLNKGYNYAYADWPQELKDEYTYNPEQAKQLLTEAGYPDGFKTTILVSTAADVALVEILKDLFNDVGVEMEINLVDPPTEQALGTAFNYEMYWNRITGSTADPTTILRMNYSTAAFNFTRADDATYDAMCDQMASAMDMDEVKQLCVQLDQYDIERHWGVRLFPVNTYNVWRPELKGYSNETFARGYVFWARLWKE